MSESDLLEDEDLIVEEDLILEEDEDLIVEVCTLSGCFSTPSGFRGFGIQEDGPTLAQDAERKLMDTVIGIPDPRVLETQELDEIEDHKLDPRPFHKDFREFVQMHQNRMSVGAIDDGREVAVGSYMSPKSVLRMLRGLAPKDIFDLLEVDAPRTLPKPEEPIELVNEPVSSRVTRVRMVVG
jgi:hypothetical protein